MREHADVHALGVANNPIEWCATEASAPAAAEVVADKDLGDAMKPRVVEDHSHRVPAFQDVDTGLLSASERDVSVKRHLILGGQVLLGHIHREQLAVKTIDVPPTAGEHPG